MLLAEKTTVIAEERNVQEAVSDGVVRTAGRRGRPRGLGVVCRSGSGGARSLGVVGILVRPVSALTVP